jgi:uncharacterized protein YndB with AHSA1/START domain
MKPSPARQFETEIRIAAPRDAVWRALAEAREIARWFAPTVEVEPGVGGRILWEWGRHHSWSNTIESWQPGQHLRTRYDSPVDDGRGGKRPLFVDFHLQGDGGVTTLRLVHSGFGPEAAFDAEFDGISSGWPVELRSLRHYLENHRGRDRQLAWATRSTQDAPAEVWRRLVGADGFAAPGLTAIAAAGRYRLVVPGAGPIEGSVLFSPSEREFSGVADNLGKGWLRLHCERWAGATQVWVWLALYGSTAERVASFQTAFDRLLDRVVPAAASGAEQGT